MNCSDNLDGSYAIGNGEVDSSILSGSTSFHVRNISKKTCRTPQLKVARHHCVPQFADCRPQRTFGCHHCKHVLAEDP
jgi:hypothetical protein